ncbi:MAG: Rv3235 family protein [Mobilicoccus sp.]|nr:Rv3235 family protein [Mobilicoccus sp.]
MSLAPLAPPAPPAPPTRVPGDASPVALVRRSAHLRPAPGTAGAPRLRVVDDFGPVGTCATDLPDPHQWVSRIALALFEASVGARSATQVLRFLSPEVYDGVVRRSGRAARRGGAMRRPIRLRRVRVDMTPVADGSPALAEACAVIDDHQRVRAMALRLEGLDGRWVVTACEIG